jgi:hypothetical protein
MSTSDPVGGGRGGVRWWRGMRVRLRRPARTGKAGLLLVLTVLVGVSVLVDEPVQPGPGPRLPGIFQVLPPPVGIIQPRPWIVPSPAGSGRLARQAGGDELLQRTPDGIHIASIPDPASAGSWTVRRWTRCRGQFRACAGSTGRPVDRQRQPRRPRMRPHRFCEPHQGCSPVLEAGRRPPALQAA